MKRFIFFVIALYATVIVFGQVPRNMVIMETGTSTLCTYCPGSAMGADDLIANGCAVAVIEYHSNGLGTEPFTNSYSTARNAYYNITGLPTAFFDGVLSYVGGSHTVSMYPQYLPLYNQRHAIQSPLTIDISGTSPSSNVYNITLSVHKVSTITASDMRLHCVLTESAIPYSWEGLSILNYVERLMVPDQNGTNISFGTGDMQIVTLTFTKDASWVNGNCELISFVQDNTTKEILQGVKVSLNSLQPPMAVDFTGTPTTGCAPLTTNFTSIAPAANTYQWSFPGGTPASATTQNVSVTYSTAGTNDVALMAWSTTTWKGNKATKTGYITATSTPVAPGTPTGNASMCSNPGSVVYTTSGSTGATSYNWDLQPPSAGTLTNNGTSCTVAWSSSYIGTANLKVQATNSCGTGPWSASLIITLYQVPTVPGTPTGPAQICQDPPNTVYNTSGATPATSYTWEIVPSTAGTLTPAGTTVTVDWAGNFVGTAQLHVAAINGTCQGSWSAFLDIVVSTGPGIFNVTGGGAYCGQGGNGSPVGVSGSQTGVDYTLYLNGTSTSNVVSGTGSPISFGNQINAGNYTVVASYPGNSYCNVNMNGTVTVSVDPQVPDAPASPNGPTTVHSGSTPNTDYSTTGGTYATTYTWELTPISAGTIAGTTSIGTATWDNAFIGTAHIKVKGVNSCGGGSFSNELTVSVDNSVGIAEIKGKKTLSIYPNPANETLNIQTGKTLVADIRIYNSLGSIVLAQQKVELKAIHQVDVSQLKPGVYFIRITGNDVQEIQKIVIQ
ncbi:MAG: T9SS type A sorting domain-containing protein [Bacteroidetes bacterium]|nr:T9SS type A sorting domain-containing protein [Bacteroidota bacterium]